MRGLVRPGDFFMFWKLGADYNDVVDWRRRMSTARNILQNRFPDLPGTSGMPAPPEVSPPSGAAASGGEAALSGGEAAAAGGAAGRGIFGRALGNAAASADPSLLNAGGRILGNELLFRPLVGGAANAVQNWGLGGDKDSGGGGKPELGAAGEFAGHAARAVGSVIPGAAGKALYFAPELGASGGAAAGRATSGWDIPEFLSNALGVESHGTGQQAELGPRAQAMMHDLKATPDDISNMRIQDSKARMPAPVAPGAKPVAQAPTPRPGEFGTDRKGNEPVGWEPAWAKAGPNAMGPSYANLPKVESPKPGGLSDVAAWKPGKSVGMDMVKNPEKDKMTIKPPASPKLS